MHVEFDDMRGEVRAAGTRAPLAPAGRAGEVRVGGSAGPVLRPVGFAERSAVAAAAAAASDPVGAVCAALRRLAVVRSGRLDAGLLDLVALALAGADAEDAPPFATTAALVVRATGAGLDTVLAAPARDVDRLVGPMRGADDGWTRVSFAAGGTPDALREHLARALLARAAPPDPVDAGTTAPCDAIAGAGTIRPGGRSTAATRAGSVAADDDDAAWGAAARADGSARVDGAAPGLGHAGAGLQAGARRSASAALGGADPQPAREGLGIDGANPSSSGEGSGGAAPGRASATAWPASRRGLEAAAPWPASRRQLEAAPAWPAPSRELASAARPPAAVPRLLAPHQPAPGAPGGVSLLRPTARRGRDDRVELDVADALARALQDEADLRGLDR